MTWFYNCIFCAMFMMNNLLSQYLQICRLNEMILKIKPNDYMQVLCWNYKFDNISALHFDIICAYQDQILLCSFSFCISSPGLVYTRFMHCFIAGLILCNMTNIIFQQLRNWILCRKRCFWKLGRRDGRFLWSTIYSYLGVNSNYLWFLHITSASRAVIPIWFEYWDIQNYYFDQVCNILVAYSLIMFFSTPSL